MGLIVLGIIGPKTSQRSRSMGKKFSQSWRFGLELGTMVPPQCAFASSQWTQIITKKFYLNAIFLFTSPLQDNPTPHLSASTKMFSELHERSILKWPPCSPDCNPIENLWGNLVRRAYDGGNCCENVGDLIEAIIAACDSLEIDEVRKIVMSFPKRLIEVIPSGGAASTSY